MVRLSASAGGWVPQRADDGDVAFAYWVLQAIGRGSSHESPFLHCTRDLQVAKNWRTLGRSKRRDFGNYLVRINRAAVDAQYLVDMSTKARQDLLRLSASSLLVGSSGFQPAMHARMHVLFFSHSLWVCKRACLNTWISACVCVCECVCVYRYA